MPEFSKANRIQQVLMHLAADSTPRRLQWAALVVILGVGIFARTWEFQRLPPGLNQDEASIGVEAYMLLHFGVDRNGVSYPIHFISWGNGQNAPYAYLLIPLIAVLGRLTPVIIRLPMLLAGILALPLTFYVGRVLRGTGFGLLSMFLLAISPWHILLSRFALDANLFPFIFLLGFACLLNARIASYWFIFACALFALCFYTYGTSYVAVPVFLFCASLILMRSKSLTSTALVIGVAVFAVLAIPVVLFVVINTLSLHSLSWGPVTIPRYPIEARFSPILGGLSAQNIASNLVNALLLLLNQSDGLIYNSVDPFGYFYRVTFPFAVIGVALLVMGSDGHRTPEDLLLLAWLGASVLVGAVVPVNINRFNIIFIPLLLALAVFLQWLNHRIKHSMAVSVAALLAGFLAFTIVYHGPAYRRQMDWKFHAGLLPALQFVDRNSRGPVCMTDEINMPYIFVLFSEKPDPAVYLPTMTSYIDPQTGLRMVTKLGRYTFGTSACEPTPQTTYLLGAGETRPRLGNRYDVAFFDNFAVYYPRTAQ